MRERYVVLCKKNQQLSILHEMNMKITINDERKIFAVQQEFSGLFPYLRIEFHAKPEKKGGIASKKMISASSKTIGECRVIHKKGTITITPNLTVAELEEHFRDVFGLTITIYRRSGKTWLRTSLTSSWTLGEQNRMGEELSKHSTLDEDQAAE